MRNFNPNHVYVTLAVTIGGMAYESLSEVQQGSVFGLSSRGIFIKTQSKWLIFLSFERFRGPLTINLSPNAGSISEVEVGMEIEISSQKLYFPDIEWTISLQEAEIWQPIPATGTLGSRGDRQTRLVRLANEITKINSDTGLAYLLPQLLEIPDQQKSDNNVQPGLYGKIQYLQHEMNSSGTLPPTSDVISLLGLGTGLTPSGDDFILGMLLVLNRWKDLFPKPAELELLNRQAVAAAYQKTTTLSANLIECASLGLGDERLIDALDWLVSESEDDTIPVDNLLSWGSSSGVDAFVGYVIALSIA